MRVLRHRLTTARLRVHPRCTGTPRPPRARSLDAGRSPGSRVLTGFRLLAPRDAGKWHGGTRLAAHSCGGSSPALGHDPRVWLSRLSPCGPPASGPRLPHPEGQAMIPRIDFEPNAAAPLDGIRVVDLSRLVAGNMVSLQLADQGAEVIKIEDPKVGDPLRAWRVKGLSLHWKVYARNKKSLAINLRPRAGRDALLDLLATSHVLIENYRPGTLEQMGLGPGILHARSPGLIIVRITGFGQDGPYRDRPGFGRLVEAMSGFAAKNGYGDRPPVLPPLALADMVAGLYGAYAVMIALRVAEQGGNGQVIDLPLLDPIISILGPEAASYHVSGEKPQRTGSRSLTTSPRNVYPTKDGRYIAISASIQAMGGR